METRGLDASRVEVRMEKGRARMLGAMTEQGVLCHGKKRQEMLESS